jgi:hypothetical protein
MIIGGFAAGVRILLEKGKFQKNTKKLYFPRRLRKPEGGGERSQGVGSHTGGAA